MSFGQEMTGASRSLTLMLKLQPLVLPEASVTVQLTRVVPLAKALPLAGSQMMLAPGQLSAAAGAKITIWLHTPGAVLVVISLGQAIVGGSVSMTMTAKLQLVVLPAVSVAVQLTTFVPVANTLPFVGLQLTL